MFHSVFLYYLFFIQPDASDPGNDITYIGDADDNLRRQLHLNYPIQHGIVTDWDDMERLLHHTFEKELRVDPTEHNVLMSEPALNPNGNKEKMAQVGVDENGNMEMMAQVGVDENGNIAMMAQVGVDENGNIAMMAQVGVDENGDSDDGSGRCG